MIIHRLVAPGCTILLCNAGSCAHSTFEDDLPEEAKILHFPHFNGTLPSRMFSGYVNITGTSKRLFYILALSQQRPESDPLLFWTNGGPGCSSLGAFFEVLYICVMA